MYPNSVFTPPPPTPPPPTATTTTDKVSNAKLSPFVICFPPLWPSQGPHPFNSPLYADTNLSSTNLMAFCPCLPTDTTPGKVTHKLHITKSNYCICPYLSALLATSNRGDHSLLEMAQKVSLTLCITVFPPTSMAIPS